MQAIGGKVRVVSPYSRAATLAKLDGRTKEARVMQGVRAELCQHVGGKPSATVSALIDRAAWLTLHVGMLDAKAMEAGGIPTDHDSRQYLAWSASLVRTLQAIGLKGAAAKPVELADYLKTRAAAA